MVGENSWISVELVSAVPTQPAASQGEGCSSSEGWYVCQHFLFDFPFDDIYRRLLFFPLIRYVCATLAITSLLEGFTPPSSARTKGDDTRYYVYTFLVRISTFSSWFSVWWDIPTSAFFHSYQIRIYNTCRCTINSTAVSLFVYSLVGGGTHDTYVPPKKQLYRYLFIR